MAVSFEGTNLVMISHDLTEGTIICQFSENILYHGDSLQMQQCIKNILIGVQSAKIPKLQDGKILQMEMVQAVFSSGIEMFSHQQTLHYTNSD